jgi:hypothetical protein
MSEFTLAKGAILTGGTTTKGSTIAGLGTDTAPVSADTGDELTALILKYGRYMDENNCPEEGRYCVLPTWCGEVLKSIASGNNFGLAYATGQNSANILTGNVPKIDRFDIYFSNLLPATMNTTIGADDASSVIFGQKVGCTFATQITESRIIDNPFSFGKMMQGLQVYGFNIIKPQMVGVSFIKNAA